MIVPFAEYAPDRWNMSGSQQILNVIPTRDGYLPCPGFNVFSNALTARAQGAATFRSPDGIVNTFAGDATKLYELTGATFSDVSGATYSTASDEQWEFAQFGAECIATNYADAVQGFTMGTDSAFSNLITSTRKPKAKHIGIVREFVVLGNTNDGTDGVQPTRVWWSAINDSTDFDPDQATLCDYQDLPDGGHVQKIVDGIEYGLIFQDDSITRMTFVGTPAIFQFDKIDRKRGAPLPGGVIGWGRHAFFPSEDGFFYTDGTQSHPIGNAKVDRTFWNTVDANNKHRVTAAVWPDYKCVVWSYPSTASGGDPDKLLIFNWAEDKWSEVDVDLELLVRTQTEGYTLDGLDTIGTDIDNDFSLSFDSRAWMGAVYKLGAFDLNNKLGYFDGSNLAATLDTQEVQHTQGRKTRVRRIRPLVDGSSVTPTVTVGKRDRQDEAVGYESEITLESGSGTAAVNVKGRYHTYRVKTPAGDTWDHALGVDVEEAFPSSRR